MRTSCLSCLAKAIQALLLQALGRHTYYACKCSASTATCASVRLPSSCPPACLPPCLPTHLVQSAQAAVRNYHGPGNLNSRLHVSQFWRLRNPRFLISMSLIIFCLLFSFVDYVPVKGDIIWYLTLTTWLISLSIMLSSSIHIVAKGRNSFFLPTA